MRLLIFMTFLGIPMFHLFAQNEKAAVKAMVARFHDLYNNGRYDSIYQLFSPEMRKALPPDQTKNFLSDLNRDAGKIISLEFDRYDAPYSAYKSRFERGLFSFHISIDKDSRINGFFIKPYTEEEGPKMTRNRTALRLPFSGKWHVVWGGDTKEQNYHVESRAQKNAFDLVILDDKQKSYRNAGTVNEDYYAFGKEILAPCAGTVVLVVDGIRDNRPGVLNPMYVPGNTVILLTDNREYLFFAHFKQHSVTVKPGQKIPAGTVLGLCGNSGNSSEPHLHFHIQNTEDLNAATGVKCYFEKILVNGAVKKDYSPVKGDQIQNTQ